MKKSVLIGVLVFFIVFGIGSRFVPGPRCADGTRSSAIGKSGACSHHGGVFGSLWNIPLIAGSLFLGFKTYDVLARRERKRAEKQALKQLPFEYGDINQYEDFLRSQGIDESQIKAQLDKYTDQSSSHNQK